MPVNLELSIGSLFGFLMVLARMAGLFVLAPLPGMRSGPPVARVVFALLLTVSLSPLWPRIAVPPESIVLLAGWLALETVLGLGMGLFLAFLAEGFMFATQAFALQAGYAYASTVDPNSDADSTVLTVMSQMFAGVLFYTCGMDRELIRALARSLEVLPPGGFTLSLPQAGRLVECAGTLFGVGLRLALPILALLLIADLTLALLGRINNQLQLLTLAFPLKMLITLLMMALLMGTFASVYESYARKLSGALAGWVALP